MNWVLTALALRRTLPAETIALRKRRWWDSGVRFELLQKFLTRFLPEEDG